MKKTNGDGVESVTMDELVSSIIRRVSPVVQIPVHMLMPQSVMLEAALTFGMFVMWAWVEEATWDGKTFRYSVQLDNPITHLTISGTVSA